MGLGLGLGLGLGKLASISSAELLIWGEPSPHLQG